jgi:electron transport complex protein RnfA
MTDLLLLALGASLVNNFVLTQFLGLCPFVGVSRRFEAAAGMALATLFVLTLASGASYAAWHWILEPLGLGYLRTLVFILLIAAVVQATEMLVRASSPLLHELLGVFLPLITTNCAVLGVALINLERQHGFLESLVFGAAAAAGFGLALLAGKSIIGRHCTVAGAFDGAHPGRRPNRIGRPENAGPMATGAHIGPDHAGDP